MKKLLFLVVCSAILISGCSFFSGVDNTSDLGDNSSSFGSPDQAVPAGKVLDLSRRNLVKVDMSVFDKINLEELNLSNNYLSGALPSQIGKLKALRILNASNNRMTGVPAEIGQLSNLEILDLSNNQLTGLPNELANLKRLKILNLSGNQYSEQDLEIIRNSLPDVEYILK